MTTLSAPFIKLRLAQLGAHLVVALIALVVIGGATRVMEAGLACPDWPLCFGSLLPGRQMNLQVFLEWFHRLDAFIIGIALLVQFVFSLIRRKYLPKWLPLFNGFLLVLVCFQGLLGAFTVLGLLPSSIVTAHMAVALILVALTSGLTQLLLVSERQKKPLWWNCLTWSALLSVFGQCLLGAQMASLWASQQCISSGSACIWLDLHRGFALIVFLSILSLSVISLVVGGWPRTQWLYLLTLSLLVSVQICLGVVTFRMNLSAPLVTVSHQLIAVLLIAILAALSIRSPQSSSIELSQISRKPLMEPCHG